MSGHILKRFAKLVAGQSYVEGGSPLVVCKVRKMISQILREVKNKKDRTIVQMLKVRKTSPTMENGAAAGLRTIIRKVASQGLVRHMNGNTLDNRVENLQYVTVAQAFLHKSWTVDAVCLLDDQEFALWSQARQEWNGDMSLFQ
jgi:hypothetical protein